MTECRERERERRVGEEERRDTSIEVPLGGNDSSPPFLR